MNIIERLNELYWSDRVSPDDGVAILDAIKLIELYDDVLLIIAGISPRYPSSMLIQYAKTAITQGRLNYNRPDEEKSQ